ncbi:dipeptidase [Planctomycetes bacterium K23_9]|uniref:Membrane dipeptidase (Peptidase family M19) n=1 Tax=Stieleria marina TaxID=1930275 RepID=A0A517P1E9_9BACT|nr:Membrane dipeptidase (Peptidase family M19) [Planctomycetes bacterium K23_9]
MFVFDAHLDLSLNALEYNRDLRQDIAHIRGSEAGMNDLAGRGAGTVCFPEMRKAGIGLCVATQLAGCMKPAAPVGAWNSPAQAWAMTQGQLAWYHAMEQDGQLRQITDVDGLKEHLSNWERDAQNCPIGFILSLEGADSIRTLSDLEASHAQGLRALGPAHYGIGRYALGHDCDGPLSATGRELIAEMDRLDLILDATHLCEQTFWQVMDLYKGPIWASHHNCRTIVDDPRQLTDQQIKALADRGGVMGVALDVWMVAPNWVRLESTHPHPGATLEGLADHVDHICQLIGTVKHIGIGTDLDGGFGTEQTPGDLDTIADIQKLFGILSKRGYSDDDLESIASKNFIDFIVKAWS